MKCKKCGEEIPNNSDFCKFCGNPIGQQTDETILMIMEVASHNDALYAAFVARAKCYKYCRKYAPRPDYKDYVQHIQLQYYPQEYYKSIIYKRYFLLLLPLGILTIACFTLAIIFLFISIISVIFSLAAVLLIGIIMRAKKNCKNKIIDSISSL